MLRNNLKRLVRLAAVGSVALASFAWTGGSAHAAEVAVDGAGFLRDRELRAALERLLSSKAQPTLDANAIEDAAVILVSSLGEEGFQKPEVEIELELAGGGKKTFTFDPTFANPLPRPLAAERVKFKLKRGVRSHIDTVEFHGLASVPVDQARSFFRTEGALIVLERTNAFSQGRVNRGVDSLLGELRQKGYAEAEVRAERVAEVKGAIKLRVEVKEGPRWEVGEITFKRDDESVATLPSVDVWRGKSWTPTLEQDLREAVRQAYYNVGYPDVGVHVATETVPREDGRKVTQVVATIVPGEKVAVGAVRFEGNKVTREKVLRRRVRLNPGDALNPVELERARYRLARLGVFESVDLRYEPLDGATRDPIFTLREGPRYETNLLFGYGSYEQFRGGVEWRQMNIGGRAHQSRLELVHSVKSTSGDYSYTVPELFGESLDGTAKVFGLRRREISFLRQEIGASFTLRRAIRRISGEATAGYKFESLRSTRNTLATQDTDDTNVNVAAISFGLNGDRRDNPLRPRHGYHWASQIEAADPRFGGEATYQRYEITGGYHTNWGKSRWIHLGFSHGVITTLGSDDLTLPVNKRFFPGGDNSIRGYQRGEAAPRDADGRFIGAKAQLLLNVELEQALTQSWSVVAFVDALGSAVALRDYPFSDKLYSVGLGLRYQTLIGPVRVEYGRNVNPRTGDPSGTWQFSIGTPF